MNFRDTVTVISEIREENEDIPFIELLYVLKGFIHVRTGEKETAVKKGQFCLFAPGELHSVFSSPDGASLRVLYDEEELLSDFTQGSFSFDFHRLTENDAERIRIINLLSAIVKEYAWDKRTTRMKSMYYLILDLIVSNCMQFDKTEDKSGVSGIIAAMRRDPASIRNQKEYADEMFLSESAFSRLFAKTAGKSFRDYVIDLRLNYAKRLLSGTGDSVAEVAMRCGFGSVSVLQRHFRDRYSCTPTEYRSKSRIHAGVSAVEAEAVRNLLRESPNPNSADITISLTREAGEPMPKELHCINAGDAEWLMDAGLQKSFKDIPRTLNIRHVALCNIFDSAFRIRRDHETENLHFDRLDQLFDMFIELSCIPVLILPESKKLVVREVTGSIEKQPRLFADTEEWLKVFRAFLLHVIERYTYHVVREWIFVIEHDPQRSSANECEEYLELYEKTRRILRTYVPDAGIWASSLNSNVRSSTLKNELRYWKTKGILPDALSLMLYPYRMRPGRIDGSRVKPVVQGFDVDMGFLKEEMARYDLIAGECGCEKLPRMITEWNMSISDRTAYHDSCAKACHMLVQMKDGIGLLQRMFYRYLSDASLSGYDADSPFIGAGGLVTRDGIRKPSWYAMEFWGQLGAFVISRGDYHIATTNYRTDYQILLFHPVRMSEEYKMIPESEHSMDEFISEIEEEQKLRFTLLLKDVHGKKRMRVFRMSEQEGSAYAEWVKIGSPGHMGLTELRYLKRRSAPRLAVSVLRPENGTIRMTYELERNSFALLLID